MPRTEDSGYNVPVSYPWSVVCRRTVLPLSQRDSTAHRRQWLQCTCVLSVVCSLQAHRHTTSSRDSTAHRRQWLQCTCVLSVVCSLQAHRHTTSSRDSTAHRRQWLQCTCVSSVVCSLQAHRLTISQRDSAAHRRQWLQCTCVLSVVCSLQAHRLTTKPARQCRAQIVPVSYPWSVVCSQSVCRFMRPPRLREAVVQTPGESYRWRKTRESIYKATLPDVLGYGVSANTG